jgi:hypothetical protein
MKAKFVYESISFLNEDQKSFEDLSILSKEIFNYFYNKYGEAESILEKLNFNWEEILKNHIVPLSKFDSSKYKNIKEFINAGIGLIYSKYKADDAADGGAGFFLSPKTYISGDSELSKKYAKLYPAGLVVFAAHDIGSGAALVVGGESNLMHELQHAYDFWRSKGKNQANKKYDTKKIVNSNPYSKSDDDVEKARSIYYNDTSELSAHFIESLKSHYWAGKERDKYYVPGKEYVPGFYRWELQLERFKSGFGPWDYLSDKLKKKYVNKFYTYYIKLKKIYDKEGVEGLSKLGLKYREKDFR